MQGTDYGAQMRDGASVQSLLSSQPLFEVHLDWRHSLIKLSGSWFLHLSLLPLQDFSGDSVLYWPGLVGITFSA